MRVVYILPPPNPAVGAVAFVLIVGYYAYTWVAGLLNGGVWVPLNPFIYVGSFVLAFPAALFLALWAGDGRGIRRWVLGTAAVAVAVGWLFFVLDRSLDWQDRRDAVANYAGWEELHSDQPSGDDADIHIDPSVLEATRRAGLGLPELPASLPRKDRNAAVRAWQRKALASSHLWRDGFMNIHFQPLWEADTTRLVPYLWFRSFFSLPTVEYKALPGTSRGACETFACIAGADVECSAMFTDMEANAGLRPAPTLFVIRERVLSQGFKAIASAPQPNGTLTPEGRALLRHPPRWLDRYPKVVKYCRDRLNMPT